MPGDEYSRRRSRWALVATVCGLLVLIRLTLESNHSKAPESPVSAQRAARLYYQAKDLAAQGQAAAALQAVESLRQLDPNQAEPYLLQAKILSDSGHHIAAKRALTLARRHARNPPLLLEVLRQAEGLLPREDMESIAREVVAGLPDSAEARYLLGRALLLSHRDDRSREALKEFELSHRLEPASAPTLLELGRLHLSQGQKPRAAEMLVRAAAILDQGPIHGPVPATTLGEWLRQRRTVAFWLARAYEETGKRQQSRQQLRLASRFSDMANELRTVRNRARADPPEAPVRDQLHQMEQLGLDYWKSRSSMTGPGRSRDPGQ